MTTPYDVSLGTTARCNQEVVGMYYNKRHLAELHRAESFDSDGVALCRVTLVPEPDNPHDKNGHAISVRWRDKVIGHLPEEVADAHWQLSRIAASGYTAETLMRVRTYVDWENDRQFHGHVSLPDPDLCVPLNDPPSEGWALLPWGSAIQVTKESDHLDVLLDFVPPHGKRPDFGHLPSVRGGCENQVRRRRSAARRRTHRRADQGVEPEIRRRDAAFRRPRLDDGRPRAHQGIFPVGGGHVEGGESP